MSLSSFTSQALGVLYRRVLRFFGLVLITDLIDAAVQCDPDDLPMHVVYLIDRKRDWSQHEM